MIIILILKIYSIIISKFYLIFFTYLVLKKKPSPSVTSCYQHNYYTMVPEFLTLYHDTNSDFYDKNGKGKSNLS
jgi:hypothetical protein